MKASRLQETPTLNSATRLNNTIKKELSLSFSGNSFFIIFIFENFLLYFPQFVIINVIVKNWEDYCGKLF